MEVKKKTITIDGEEITASENWFKKFEENVGEEVKMELARDTLKKEYQCFRCKILPRPGTKDVRKCTSYCLRIFCNACSLHHCPNTGGQYQANQSVPITLSLTLDVGKYSSFFCKNYKFGCKEIFVGEAKLLDHEKNCIFQVIHCADIDCKLEVGYLDYLDHFKEKHVKCENLGDGKMFKLPIDFNKLQKINTCSTPNCTGTPVVGQVNNFIRCQYCNKVFCNRGRSSALNYRQYTCAYHQCNEAGNVVALANIAVTVDAASFEKWLPKKFTAFNKTFFEVGLIRNKFIYKWIYVLGLPDEAKNFYFHANVQNENGENVHAYYDQVRSLVESPDEVMENENCFIIGLKNAKKFVKRGTNSVDVSLKIRNLKDEAKDDDEESGIDD